MTDACNNSGTRLPELESLTDALPTALILIDRQGRIVMANTLVSKTLGLSPDLNLVGMLMWQALPVGLREIVATMQREVLIYCSEARRDFELVKSDSSVSLIDMQMAQIPGKNVDTEFFSLTLSDATARQEIAELKKVDHLKSNFMALVSHELRTPLTSIRGAVHLLADKEAVANPPEKTLVDIIQSNSERLIRLVNNLLEMVAIDNDTFAVNPSPSRVDKLINTAIARNQDCAESKFIAITYDANPIMATVDPERFQQMICYLLDNAIKFTPTGGRISISTDIKPHGALHFNIKDSGCGVPPHEREKVFDRFYQVEDPMIRCSGGSGVGLYLARTIVEMHGGQLLVDSHCDGGSDFHGTMPVRASNYAEMGSVPSAKQS